MPLGPLPSPGPPQQGWGAKSPRSHWGGSPGRGADPGTPGEVWGESLPCPQPTLEGHQLWVVAPNAEGRGRWGKPSAPRATVPPDPAAVPLRALRPSWTGSLCSPGPGRAGVGLGPRGRGLQWKRVDGPSPPPSTQTSPGKWAGRSGGDSSQGAKPGRRGGEGRVLGNAWASRGCSPGSHQQGSGLLGHPGPQARRQTVRAVSKGSLKDGRRPGLVPEPRQTLPDSCQAYTRCPGAELALSVCSGGLGQGRGGGEDCSLGPLRTAGATIFLGPRWTSSVT